MNVFQIFWHTLRYQYADFRGRTSRRAYWSFFLVFQLINIAFKLASNGLEASLETTVEMTIGQYVAGAGLLGISIALLIPMFAATARRLHDVGRSGWLQLLHLLPLIGSLILIAVLADEGKKKNRWGLNPKAEMMSHTAEAY